MGIEETPREDGTDYELFIKQVPTLRAVYRNPTVCGECDVGPFANLTPAVKSQFAEFCRVRFGISEVRACYGIYLERQRMANEGRTDLRMGPAPTATASEPVPADDESVDAGDALGSRHGNTGVR